MVATNREDAEALVSDTSGAMTEAVEWESLMGSRKVHSKRRYLAVERSYNDLYRNFTYIEPRLKEGHGVKKTSRSCSTLPEMLGRFPTG